MPSYDINSAVNSDYENNVEDFAIDALNTDGITNQDETTWQDSMFTTRYGYYKKIPEVKIAIDTRAIWTIGDGFTTQDPYTQVVLDHLSGCGIDTFDSILENMVIIKRVGGDAYSEIIRADDKDKTLLNLKPLDPSSIKIVYGKNGRIKHYLQTTKLGDGQEAEKKFQTNEIFHLTNKRVADEIHGVSDIEAIEDIILANKENFNDIKKFMHRHVKPFILWKLKTDDDTKISAFVAKVEKARNLGEDLFIPDDEGIATYEVVSVSTNETLSPISWRENLKNYFFQVVGIPQIIMGSSGEFTESTAKIAYLAFEQSVKEEQREIIIQIQRQLGLKIDLAFPASLKNELLSDESKDASSGLTGQLNVQPNEVTAGVGR